MFAGIHMAHIWRKDELIPNALLPKISKIGTVNPINGPETYQGHGSFMISIKFIFCFFI